MSWHDGLYDAHAKWINWTIKDRNNKTYTSSYEVKLGVNDWTLKTSAIIWKKKKDKSRNFTIAKLEIRILMIKGKRTSFFCW